MGGGREGGGVVMPQESGARHGGREVKWLAPVGMVKGEGCTGTGMRHGMAAEEGNRWWWWGHHHSRQLLPQQAFGGRAAACHCQAG